MFFSITYSSIGLSVFAPGINVGERRASRGNFSSCLLLFFMGQKRFAEDSDCRLIYRPETWVFAKKMQDSREGTGINLPSSYKAKHTTELAKPI